MLPSKAKPGSVPSLKPIQKNRQEELKFTFDVSKCDRIFDELLKNGNIRLSHAIPSPDELKRYAYCKWHNSTSHATTDCNVFHRQVQLAINERRLVLSKMQIDKAPFAVHTLELNNPKVLIRQEQAEGAKGKHVVIGDPRPMNTSDKILAREVIKEKTDDGKSTLKIIIRNPRLGGQGSSPPENRSADQERPARPMSQTGQTGMTGQTGSSNRSDRPGDRPQTFKPKCPEVGTWKTNEVKVQGRAANQKPTFNQLLNKYTKAVQNDRPLKKRPRSPPCQDRPASPRRESSRRRGDVVTLYPPQKMYATMPWMPPASNATNPAWQHGGI